MYKNNVSLVSKNQECSYTFYGMTVSENISPSAFSYAGESQAAGPLPGSPPPLCVAKTGRNNFNEDFTPLLPTGIGERF